MISKDTLTRGYNKFDYVVGAPTPPLWVDGTPEAGEHSLQVDPVVVSDDILEQLRGTGASVATGEKEVIAGTRDWWARTMIAETSGNPPTPVATIVMVKTVDQVVDVVKIASANSIPITVSAGRSNVTGSALPLRGGIVLDTTDLNKFIGVDPVSQIAEVEAGMYWDVFETEVQNNHGLTAGNYPSGFGQCTIGGQIACRGAGQLSTRYGKIEDMVYGLDVVMPNGDLVTLGESARGAVGPDLKGLIVGSEGTLGVVVRARIMLHKLPDYAKAFAVGYETFADGLDACRRILQAGTTPAVVRLYDKLESGIQFGKPDTNVLLVADEGNPSIVDVMLEVAHEICREKGEELDGDAIFERWLETRMLLGKSADGFKKNPGFVSDTLEMVGSWKDLPAIYDEVVQAVESVDGTQGCSAHMSHAYVSAGCIYFSMRGTTDVEKRTEWYREIWDRANAVLIKHDATLSHHHGVGLVRARFMEPSLGSGFSILQQVKKCFDPKNIFNPGKLGLD